MLFYVIGVVSSVRGVSGVRFWSVVGSGDRCSGCCIFGCWGCMECCCTVVVAVVDAVVIHTGVVVIVVVGVAVAVVVVHTERSHEAAKERRARGGGEGYSESLFEPPLADDRGSIFMNTLKPCTQRRHPC